jgi:hypothetical protein
MKPSIGRIVHYVSYGTPGGEYKSECRAAIVTEVQPGGGKIVPETVSLAVLNPTGMFFNEGVVRDDGAGQPGDPECPHPHGDGPHRYCACGWTEASHRGGTWHWPERISE